MGDKVDLEKALQYTSTQQIQIRTLYKSSRTEGLLLLQSVCVSINSPDVLRETLALTSTERFAPLHPHSDSVWRRRSAHPRSSLWSPCICGSGHRCTLWVVVNIYFTLNTCLSSSDLSSVSLYWICTCCQYGDTHRLILTSDNEVCVWEKAFSLHESSGMPRVKNVKDAICIHPDRSVSWMERDKTRQAESKASHT